MQNVVPATTILEKSSFIFSADVKPIIAITDSAITIVSIPITPISSAMTEIIKSVCEDGRKKSFCIPSPIPLPVNPPDEYDIIDCIIWYPLPRGSFQGSRKTRILFNLYGDIIASSANPATAGDDIMSRYLIFVPAINSMKRIVSMQKKKFPKSG